MVTPVMGGGRQAWTDDTLYAHVHNSTKSNRRWTNLFRTPARSVDTDSEILLAVTFFLLSASGLRCGWAMPLAANENLLWVDTDGDMILAVGFFLLSVSGLRCGCVLARPENEN
jgi:hypothetical protein